MPFDSGTHRFARMHSWVSDVEKGNTTILAARVDEDTDDIAAGLNALNDGSVPRTGPLRLPDGTESAPALAFSGATNTGLYRSSDGALKAVVGGTAPLSLTAGGLGQVWARKVTLADGATIAPDFAKGNFFDVTLAGNRTLGAPQNARAGQSGLILIRQDSTGSRTLAFHEAWKFAGGATPVLPGGADTTSLLGFTVLAPLIVFATLIKDIK